MSMNYIMGGQAPDKITVESYQKTFFSSDAGIATLTHILMTNCLFHEIVTEEDRIAHNRTLLLLKNLGVWEKNNVLSIVKMFRRIAQGKGEEL